MVIQTILTSFHVSPAKFHSEISEVSHTLVYPLELRSQHLTFNPYHFGILGQSLTVPRRTIEFTLNTHSSSETKKALSALRMSVLEGEDSIKRAREREEIALPFEKLTYYSSISSKSVHTLSSQEKKG